MAKFSVDRYHDISVGHRVHGHEGKCQFLHGHNYRVHFKCVADEQFKDELDDIGRVIDFGVIKERLCMWLEREWDHKFLAWNQDPFMDKLYGKAVSNFPSADGEMFANSIVWVNFNPTAENMAEFLVVHIGPEQLHGTGVILQSVTVEETRKCSATYSL